MIFPISTPGRRSFRAGLLALAAAVLLGPAPGIAGGKINDTTIDYSLLTCAELKAEIDSDIKKGTSADEASALNIIAAAMWIDGYLSHETGDTTTSQDWISAVIQAIGESCPKSPNRSILNIVKSKMK